MNNNAPFYVGQKVVRTGPTKIDPNCIKGKKYTVKEQIQCTCKKWYVTMEEFSVPPPYNSLICSCGQDSGSTGKWWGAPKHFQPVKPLYADITAELASKVEVGDTADQPVRVLSN